MAEDLYTACAEELAVTPQLVSRLLADHAPDAAGWCRAHDAHAEKHPCSIRRLAELAHEHVSSRRPLDLRRPA